MSHQHKDDHALPTPGPDARRIRMVIAAGVAVLLLALLGLYLRAASRTNHVALSASPKPVSVVKAVSTSYRAHRTYVGTTMAWNQAKVGPQYVSAYVGAVLVRPGAVVKKGQVLATLDCRNASAGSQAMAARAKAMEQRQIAVEHETQRTRELTAGGFASANEVEQLSAKAASEKAEGESLRASLVSKSLEVDDCILRAPFDGEVADRYADPGAYLRPGNPVVLVIDRSLVRVAADAPESDFALVGPDAVVQIAIDATKLEAKVSRRAPAADDISRTVHFEIDLSNRDHALPVGITARLTIAVGAPQPAVSVPIRAATLRNDRATVFVVDNHSDGEIARRRTVAMLGEDSGLVYLDPQLGNARVVIEGRALLDDNDRVAAKDAP